jgi:hypothetical protein
LGIFHGAFYLIAFIVLQQFQKLRLDKPKRHFRLKCEFMKIIRAIIASACLMFLCSCATQDSIRPPLPVDALINKGAGDDDRLYLTLRLESGEKLLFGVDTGMPFTVLDKSLESKLGKRLGTSKGNYSWYGKRTTGVYGAPKLYLGNTQLMTSDRILTDDLSKTFPDTSCMGILGMDCLRHYCIQLDFDAGKMRFLDPDHLKTNALGKAFPITISHGEVLTHENFLGLKNVRLIVDTGCSIDAALESKLVQQKLQEQKAEMTNETKTAAGVPVRIAYFDKVVLNDNVYRHFILSDCPDDNLLGLRFLARHLVTLNFPKRIMYLRRNGEWFGVADDLSIEAEKFLSNLKEKGQLPGWLQDEHGNMSLWIPGENNPEVYPVSRTFNGTKNGDVSKYHYAVVKASKDDAWKLQRAWRTDASGHILNEYPVP